MNVVELAVAVGILACDRADDAERVTGANPDLVADARGEEL
jgi:hypothetical protein